MDQHVSGYGSAFRRAKEYNLAPRLTLLLAATLCTIALPLDAAAQSAFSRNLSVTDWLDWEEVSSPQISPDGRQIVYQRRWVDKMTDSWESSLWVMDSDGSRNRQLRDGSSPRWSPDGTRIAFLHDDEEGNTQIFVRWMDAEGAVSQLTRLTENSPRDIAWSPDGGRIAFRMRTSPERPVSDYWRIELPTPEGAEWTRSPRIVESLVYRQDRVGFLDEGFDHLFVVSVQGGTPRQVTRGDHNHGAPSWDADGRRLVFDGLLLEDAEYEWGRHSEIYDVEVETGAVRQLTNRRGPDGSPVPSPDGRHIAFVGHEWTDDTYFERKLYVMESDGSGMREIAASVERTPSDVTWAPDGSGVYFNVDDRGSRNLYFAALDGSARQVTEGNHVLTIFGIARGLTAVGTVTSHHDPGTLVVIDLQGQGEMRPLLRTNEELLSEIRLGEAEELWYRSFDDWEIQGWIIKPPDFDPSRRYPLILAIHGGPHSMYNVGFNFGWQHHAAAGYVVLYTNPRGSSGYGSEFGNAIKFAYPGDDYFDLMAGVDAVVELGYVDEENMFVYGCSGGGVLTAWVVGQTDRFRAASSNCPVINWLSFGGTVDGNPIRWYKGGRFEHFPWEDPTGHLERSPLMYVGNVTTPVMLMTGVRDLRTPISQTEEYYQALKAQNKPAAMVRFEEEWHGTSSKPSNRMRTQLYLHKWFERWGDHEASSMASDGSQFPNERR